MSENNEQQIHEFWDIFSDIVYVYIFIVKSK